MPRLTEATRRSRRDQIAAAAMQLFARNGFATTSMADIVEASGLSAGSIYSHFTDKADLVRHVASRVIADRTERIAELAAGQAEIVTPGRMLRLAFESDPGHERAAVLLQVWAQAPRDDRLAAALRTNLQRFQLEVTDGLEPWSRSRDDGRAAPAAANLLFTVFQGLMVRLALDPDFDLAAALDVSCPILDA